MLTATVWRLAGAQTRRVNALRLFIPAYGRLLPSSLIHEEHEREGRFRLKWLKTKMTRAETA
jgi:hypothetical protein